MTPPPFWGGITPLLFRGGEEPRSGGGVGFVRQTQHQPDKPHPNPVEPLGPVRGTGPSTPEGAGRVQGITTPDGQDNQSAPSPMLRMVPLPVPGRNYPPPPCFAWSRCCSATPAAPPCRGGFSPLLFRGGEEPRSGGGVGFVRQTQHQPDKPHPNPVEGRGAFGVSPRHKVSITKAPLHHASHGPPPRAGEELPPLPHASHGPAVAPQRLRLPRAGEELPPSSLGEGRSRAAAEGWGLSVKRSTSPTSLTPTSWRGGVRLGYHHAIRSG
jgi:hypothetical protein